MKAMRRWIALIFAALFLAVSAIPVFADFPDVDVTHWTDEEWRARLEERAAKADIPLICRASETSLHPGDIFTVTVSVLSIPTAESIRIECPLNSQHFELIAVENLVTGRLYDGQYKPSHVTFYPPDFVGNLLKITYRVKETAPTETYKLIFEGTLTKPDVPTPILPGQQPTYLLGGTSSMGALLEYTIESHSYGVYESVDAEQHNHVCEDCGYTENAPHTFGEWEVSVPATAEQDGVQKRVCSDCALEESEVIPKLPSETTKETETTPIETASPETTAPETTPAETSADTTAPEGTESSTEKDMKCSGSDGWIAFAAAAAIIVAVIAVAVIVTVIRKKRKN